MILEASVSVSSPFRMARMSCAEAASVSRSSPDPKEVSSSKYNSPRIVESDAVALSRVLRPYDPRMRDSKSSNCCCPTSPMIKSLGIT